MKITCLFLCLLGLAALASADSGFFVPKAFYKLDAEGHKSNFVEINPSQANILKRLRRQTTSSGSSSTTSISSSNGGPTYVSTHEVKVSPDSAGRAMLSETIIKNGRIVYQNTKSEKL